MELHDWLLRSRFISRSEYADILNAEFKGTWSGAEFDTNGFVRIAQADQLDVAVARKHPIGAVLDRALPLLAKQVYARAGVSDLSELVFMWQQWHVTNLEPIVNHPTSCRFGANLHVNRLEKKLAAWFITNAKVRGNSIIKNADVVVIPEGSSAFYAGLAIAAYRTHVSLITSNGALYCEYLANPALARSFSDFHVIGGLADLDRDRRLPENGGMFGLQSEETYKRAIQDRPQATVIVMPVTGLLPEEGPFALAEETGALKLSIIRDGLDSGVRELVFVADYSKHLESELRSDRYGKPIMRPRAWRELLEQEQGRISLTTAPPAQLREIMKHAALVHPAARKSLDILQTGVEWSAEVAAYNRSAWKFGRQFCDEDGRLLFHEAYTCDDHVACELRQLAQCR
ncbi:MAG: hypothetical protein RBS80_19930 [Thermoguttaceae bacterium]|nr:hypothetical protein [Thermoguttaceae bacterium]